MDWVQFFGRFHILALHLPIGILALAAGAELYFGFSKKAVRPAFVVRIWFWGTASAIVACVLGYMLSLSGSYEEEALESHLIWGIATAAAALIGWLCFGPWKREGKGWAIILGGAQFATLFVAGHFGGSLTHGPEYLFEHAPNPMRELAGFKARTVPRPPVTDLAKADVYLDIVHPILELRCVSCHNPSKTKGDLLLDTYAGIMKGGDFGPSVVPGNLDESELIYRIHLDPDEEEFMPTGGKTPLTPEQTKALAWWVEIGAPESGLVSEFELDEEIRIQIVKAIGMGAKPVEVAAPQAPRVSDELVAELEALGFDVKRISEKVSYLDIDYYTVAKQPISDQSLRALSKVSEQVAWLNLGDCGLTDVQLKLVAELPNLVKLNIDRNPITNEGLAALSGLQRLELLNLHGTGVDAQAFETLDRLPNLKKAFLWGTSVTATDGGERGYLVLGAN